MDTRQAVLVVGPGAIGGALAARWALAGRPVLLLGRTAASESRLARRGLIFTGGDGKRREARAGLLSARAHPRASCSAAFFCVKSWQTHAALAAARRWIGPKTAVVGLQNGLGHEMVLRRAFGPSRTVLGSCFFAADRPEPGVITNTWGNLILLAANRANREAAQAAGSLLKEGGWEVGVKSSEDSLLWTKLCFNAATNPLGAVCAVPNGRLAEDPALREIMLRVLSEALTIAAKEGHKLLYANPEGLVIGACLNAPAQRNSMLQDLQARRKTEIDAIVGPLLSAARRRKIAAPFLSRLARLVKGLERPR